ncbi:hypothetical protein KZZ52_25410 [Dactylosporangium sp. AC04546]|uniref:hypothetical protein n=1 Tax=Dactylosporangium sp. AC04546 TaxID=2862460 RepID=UPI001EDDECA1|nr:hypothetical protein [Dactylosporangium sp. AC04546]WVK88610.1 hypothetical protein KZZ52_25410 [Dactylosporangium sp. AC04546]
MISVRTEALVVGVLLAAGFAGAALGGDPPAPSAADLAGKVGCRDVHAGNATGGERELATCRIGARDVTVVTFDDNARRDDWLGDAQLNVVTLGLFGLPEALVYGDRWAVRTDDLAAADRFVVALHGWWV